MQGKHQKRRVRILVKAFPQPSTKHEETVGNCSDSIRSATAGYPRAINSIATTSSS